MSQATTVDAFEKIVRILSILIGRYSTDSKQMNQYILQSHNSGWESAEFKELGKKLESRFNDTIQRLEVIKKRVDELSGDSLAGDALNQAAGYLQQAISWKGNMFQFTPLFYNKYIDELNIARRKIGLQLMREVEGVPTSATPAPTEKPTANKQPKMSRKELYNLQVSIFDTLKERPKPPNFSLVDHYNYSKKLVAFVKQLRQYDPKFKPEFAKLMHSLEFALNLFDQRYQHILDVYKDKTPTVYGHNFEVTVSPLFDVQAKLRDLVGKLNAMVLK